MIKKLFLGILITFLATVGYGAITVTNNNTTIWTGTNIYNSINLYTGTNVVEFSTNFPIDGLAITNVNAQLLQGLNPDAFVNTNRISGLVTNDYNGILNLRSNLFVNADVTFNEDLHLTNATSALTIGTSRVNTNAKVWILGSSSADTNIPLLLVQASTNRVADAFQVTGLEGIVTNISVTSNGTFIARVMDSEHEVYQLTNALVGTNCVITRNMGSHVGILAPTNLNFTINWPTFATNKYTSFTMCINPMGYTVNWGNGLTNTLTLVASNWNTIVFVKGCFWNKFVGYGKNAP